MPFEVGHQKVGGRRAGTPNRVTAELRTFMLEIMSDPAYLQPLRQRMIGGQAQRLEQFFWRTLLGTLPPEASPMQAALREELEAQELDFLRRIEKGLPRPTRTPVPMESEDGTQDSDSGEVGAGSQQ